MRPTGPAKTAADLASEALFYLTDPSVHSTAPLSLKGARAVIGRFTLDNQRSLDEVEQELADTLAAVGASMSVVQVIDQLRGWIDRAARKRNRSIVLSSEVLSREVALAAKYLEIPLAVQDLWSRLLEAAPSLPNSTIPAQGWREVQPGVERVSTRRALTGPGGSGKSYVLAQLYNETKGQRVWFDAQVPDGVEDAISFGAWACGIRHEPLTVFVDALDGVESPGTQLAMIDRALTGSNATVLVAARHTTWAEVRVALPGWEETPLEGWSKERVRQLAGQSRVEPLSDDLVELLRSPLLLDLFLRTFGLNEQVPSRLSTRHGVLCAYFERRILHGNPRSVAKRRAALERGASAILRNDDRWLDPSAAAEQLVGEGVLVLTYGELAFRHALLRDFAVWISLRRHDAAGIANRLNSVTNPAIRNDLLRGVLEARMDLAATNVPGPTVESIVRACTAHRLSPGIALGSSDAPTAALVAILAPLEAGATFQQALDRARLVDNRIWIRVIASIGGVRPSWLGDTQIDALSRLGQYALGTQDAAVELLARTLRGWTVRQVGDSWAMMGILKLVVRTLPDDETLAWLAHLQMRVVVTNGELLGDVRDMLVSNPNLDNALARRALSNLVLTAEPKDGSDPDRRWSLVNKCMLSSQPEMVGLLRKRPEIALPIVFELGAREAETQKRRRELENAKPKIREAIAKLAASYPPRLRDLEEAEARLRRSPALQKAEALGGLVDDAHRFLSPRMDDIGQLINAAVNLAREPASVPTILAAARDSRSIGARLLLLDGRSAASTDAVREVLMEPRIYHSVSGQQAIHEAIARHWSAFPTDARAQIQRNILDLANVVPPRLLAAGHLVTAIPRCDLNSDLVPYLDFWEQQQPTLHPEVASAAGDQHWDDEPVDAVLASPAAKRNDCFVHLEESASNPASGVAQHALAEIVDRGLLAEAALNDWFWISKVMAYAERQTTPLLSGARMHAIFDGALDRARSVAGRDLQHWPSLIRAAEIAAAHVENPIDSEMRCALFEEIVAAAGQGATSQEHVEHALLFVRGWHWSRSDSPGRELFLRWFKESLRAAALKHALHHLCYFDFDTRMEVSFGLA